MLTMRRRLKAAALVLVSQILLAGLALAWLIHSAMIVVNGSVSFVENNPVILWGEFIAAGVITLFAVYGLAVQIRRLGERRMGDRQK